MDVVRKRREYRLPSHLIIDSLHLVRFVVPAISEFYDARFVIRTLKIE